MIALERRGARPLHRQIYDAYRGAILSGSLPPGVRVPSTRVLASEIGVSRFPVLNAYAQLLAEGYLQSRVGSGTVVTGSLPEHAPQKPIKPLRSGGECGPRKSARRCLVLASVEPPPWTRVFGAFRVGQVAFDQFPLSTWSRLVARHSRDMHSLSAHYGQQMGSLRLREAVAEYLKIARSVRCDAEQIMIVNGSQQALHLTAQALFNPGDRVWVEEPGYRLGRDILALSGCETIPVRVDAEGLDVAAGLRRCRKARAAFVSPSHQFPLGVTMSASRRLQLLEWAQNAGAWVLEDDYDSEYRYESLPIASLQGLDVHSRVIYIGTFSKVLFPSLRLGYVVIPPDLVDRFRLVRRVNDLGPPTFFQDVVAEFIEEGHFARHIRRMRALYAELRETLVASLKREFEDKIEIGGDEAGMHLAMIFRNRRNDVEISDRAARFNLSLWPLSRSYLEESRTGFILGFCGVRAEDIPEAVTKLRKLAK